VRDLIGQMRYFMPELLVITFCVVVLIFAFSAWGD
jgi:hypothetical protein